jgi:hypothetical protein
MIKQLTPKLDNEQIFVVEPEEELEEVMREKLINLFPHILYYNIRTNKS